MMPTHLLMGSCNCKHYSQGGFIMYEDIFEQIHREAVKRNLKESTVAAYCRSVDYFLRTVNKDISALTTDDVDAFLTEKRLGGLAPQTYNHYHASIRFFYKRILKMNWDDEDIPRMKLDRSLPPNGSSGSVTTDYCPHVTKGARSPYAETCLAVKSICPD